MTKIIQSYGQNTNGQPKPITKKEAPPIELSSRGYHTQKGTSVRSSNTQPQTQETEGKGEDHTKIFDTPEGYPKTETTIFAYKVALKQEKQPETSIVPS